METALLSQLDRSFTLSDTAEELGGILEVPDHPEITGGYADVYHGFWTSSQGERVEVAVKVLRALVPRSRRGDHESLIKKAEMRIKREVFFWSQTRHPNLHPLLGYRLQPHPQLVSPWCHHGDLEYYLRSNPNLSRSEKLQLICQAGSGLHHLHSWNPPICHADIKPGNVLINDLCQAVLSDFGLSRALLDLDISSGFTTSETVKGTFAYMAGELSSGQKPTRESDVYAFGGLILTVMSNQAPFYGLSQLAILRRIIQNEPPKPEEHPSLPDQDPLWNLMRRCWDQSPVARPAMDQVLVELGEVIAHERPDSLTSIDPPTAVEDGGNCDSEADFYIPGGKQPEEIISLNTAAKGLELGTAPIERKLSESSTDGALLPSGSPSSSVEADSLTRRVDERDDGDAFPRTLRRQPGLCATKVEPALGGTLNNEILAGIPSFEIGRGSGSGLPRSRRDAIGPMSQKPAAPPRPSARHPTQKLVVCRALLSRVAEAFRDKITLSKLVKDGLAYYDAFDGQEAVDKIAYIIKTTDRKVAVLLGRALNAQRFFHDVTYDHPLRDSPHEIYQLKERVPISFLKKEMASAVRMGGLSESSINDDPLPSGVFTFLTDCYSPTCNRDALCYSIACPRRLEQQARLSMEPQPSLRRSLSDESLGDTPVRGTGTQWIHSVPVEISATMPDQEKKRQEAINEIIHTEREFVQDMEYLQDSWIKPLRTTNIIPEPRRAQFVQAVFWNLDEIIVVSRRLSGALNKRRESDAIVKTIGDIYLDVLRDFESFVLYGGHQSYSKFEFVKEKSLNPAFKHFAEKTEGRPESRKLEVMGYLTRPTTRLARYPLLLDVVLRYTSNDSPDRAHLVKIVDIILGLLRRINEENEKVESRLNLLQLDQQLGFRNVDQVDLRLQDENRELLYKGRLRLRGGQGHSSELQVFLLDHVLLMVKGETKHAHLRVYKGPIPLELLVIATPEKPTTDRENIKDGYPIMFRHLGRKGYDLTLLAGTAAVKKEWLEKIAKQQGVMRERSMTFDTLSLSEGFFSGENRVNCAAPFNHGSQIAYGTGNGVYFSDLRDRSSPPVQVLALSDVMQVDVLEEHKLLVVLAERSLMVIPLEALDMNDLTAGLKRAKKVSSHASFFKAGTCLGRTLVCVVKASALSSTIKVLEPIDQAVRGKNKPTFRKLLQGGNDTVKVFKEFYFPGESSSIHFLKTKLCIGCTRGFEVADLETLDYQGLLDPADRSLDFVQKRENTRPIAIYRIENEFLLCYDEFAFYVNKTGWRARPNWIVNWEGNPTSFALHFPFVLAIEPTFIEVYNVDTGQLVQIIPGKNLRCLFADIPPSIKHSAASYTNPYVRGNPYIYPQVAGAGLQEQGRDHPGTASSMPLSFDGNLPHTRDEIIIVSEDKVIAVRLAPSPASRQPFVSIVAAEERSGNNASALSSLSSAYVTAASNLSFE